MDNSLYLVIARQVGLKEQLKVTSNNVANSETDGFKRQLLYTVKDSFPEGHNSKVVFPNHYATIADFSPGDIKPTFRPYDVAIDGKGYFGILTPNGVRYTRLGDFKLDAKGELVNSDGNPVSNQSGSPIVISPTPKELVVTESGLIFADGEQLDTLGIYVFDDDRVLEPAGTSSFKTDILPDQAAVGSYRILQSSLEGSNVNSIAEITRLMETQRDAELNANFLNNIGELETNTIRTLANSVKQN